MPNFRYDCSDCHEAFVIEQALKERGAAECPRCRKTATKPVFANGAFRVNANEWQQPRDVPLRKRL